MLVHRSVAANDRSLPRQSIPLCISTGTEVIVDKELGPKQTLGAAAAGH